MNKTISILVLTIIVLGTALRLYKIDNPVADWHEFRQADTASVSRLYLKNGLDLLHPKYQDLSNIQSGFDNPKGYRFVEFPLYNALQASLAGSTGLPVVYSGRLLSVLLSIIGLFGLWSIAKIVWGDWVAILSLAFAATNAYWTYYSRVILPEPLMIALGIWSFFFFIRFVKGKSVVNAIIGGVLLGFALMVKPFVIFWFIGFPVFLILRRDFSRLAVLGVVFIFSAIPIMLWRNWIKQFPEGIPVNAWLFNGDKIRFRPAFFRWIFYERIIKLILGGWGIAAFFIGIVKKFKQDDILPFGMLAGSVLYLFVIATGNVRHDYYQILLFPSLALFIGRGLLELISGNWTSKVTGTFTAIAIFVASTAFGWYEVKGYYQINHPEIIEAGLAVDRLTPSDAKVIAPYNGDTAFLYYTNRQGWPIGYDVSKKIENGATVYASVNFDDETNTLSKKYQTIEKSSKYIILDLTKEK